MIYMLGQEILLKIPCIYGATSKDSDKEKYMYIEYGIAFNIGGFRSSDYGTAEILQFLVLIIVVNLILTIAKNNFLILSGG